MAKPISSLVTKSDEAMTFLILENNWDRWTEMWEKTKTGKYDGVSCKKIPLSAETKWTVRTGKSCSGWWDEGIERYNELAKLVTVDRERCNDTDSQEMGGETTFEKKYMDEKKKQGETDDAAKRRAAREEKEKLKGGNGEPVKSFEELVVSDEDGSDWEGWGWEESK